MKEQYLETPVIVPVPEDQQYIDQKEFMKAMFRIYYSPLETKFKLVFDMYDFDNDGVVSREDLHLVLSHIPLCVSLFKLNHDVL